MSKQISGCMDSAIVYGRMARLLEAHHTPSESMRQCLLSGVSHLSSLDKMVGQDDKVLDFLLLGTLYGSWERDLGLPLVKDMTKGFCSSLQSSSYPTYFYKLIDIKDYWAKLVDDR